MALANTKNLKNNKQCDVIKLNLIVISFSQKTVKKSEKEKIILL